MLELLRGGDADPAVAAIAAVLSRVAATLIVIVILLVLQPIALLILFFTNLTLIPLGRLAVAERLDERCRPGSLAKHCNGLRGDVNRDEREYLNT